MCESIARAKAFKDKVIHSSASLPSHVERLTLFLTTSFHQIWTELSLRYIQDYGCFILHRGLKGSSITITQLWLGGSGITSSSSRLISDIVINCRVKRLNLDSNDGIGENEQFYSILSHPSTKLEVLSMFQTNLSFRSAKSLFTTLEQNHTLKMLSIEGNDITDDTFSFISNAIKQNSCLVKSWIRYNPISEDAIRTILEALQFNNTLERLLLPDYPDDVKRHIKLMEENINKMRERHGFHIKLLIDFSAIYNSLFTQ